MKDYKKEEKKAKQLQKKKKELKLISKNKKAYFDYEIVESWEAGIELKWFEVKSIKEWNVNLKWSYISPINNELFAKQMHISHWKSLVNKDSNETRIPRKIMLKRKTIDFLIWKIKEKWFSVIPLRIYDKNNLIKIEVGLVKWKKRFEKKQILKERTLEREAKNKMMKYI